MYLQRRKWIMIKLYINYRGLFTDKVIFLEDHL